MPAIDHLAARGITLEQAKQFVTSNLERPDQIYNTCLEYDVSATMLCEIVGGINEQQVVDYFDTHNLNGSALLTSNSAYFTNGSIFQGSISDYAASTTAANNQHWLTFGAKAGTTYQFILSPGNESPINAPYLLIYDSQGKYIASDNDGGEGNSSEIILYIEEQEFSYGNSLSNYVVVISDYEGGYGSFNLHTEVIADSNQGDASSAETLLFDVKTWDTFDYDGDSDWFSLEVLPNQTYLIELDAVLFVTGRYEPSTLNAIKLVDSQGEVLATGDVYQMEGAREGILEWGKSPDDSFVTYTSDTTEMLYVEVVGTGSDTIHYSVTATII